MTSTAVVPLFKVARSMAEHGLSKFRYRYTCRACPWFLWRPTGVAKKDSQRVRYIMALARHAAKHGLGPLAIGHPADS